MTRFVSFVELLDVAEFKMMRVFLRSCRFILCPLHEQQQRLRYELPHLLRAK